jgi:hypothetical protein
MGYDDEACDQATEAFCRLTLALTARFNVPAGSLRATARAAGRLQAVR